jgi:NAD+ kinase
MKKRIINITGNDDAGSKRIRTRLKRRLEASGFVLADGFDDRAELIICIGGDGALLRTLAEHDFPAQPIVGVNTGRLGFFQELDVRDIDAFIAAYMNRKYAKQTYRTVYADVKTDDGDIRVKGLNEVVIRGGESRLAHLNIYIGDSFIEQFCGDGIVISTPAGSTAYNYSLGGSIVDPRLDLLQVTPIAPINSTAYRSFTSAILLPSDLSIGVFPEYPRSRDILIATDGAEIEHAEIREIRAGFSDDLVTILRFKDYDFWNTVKRKLL